MKVNICKVSIPATQVFYTATVKPSTFDGSGKPTDTVPTKVRFQYLECSVTAKTFIVAIPRVFFLASTDSPFAF